MKKIVFIIFICLHSLSALFAQESWLSTSTINAPEARKWFTSVWTGSKMIVWGGCMASGYNLIFLNTGGIYDPGKDSWFSTSLNGAPFPCIYSTAIWTGSFLNGKMIIWGGFNETGELYTGGIYDTATNTWTPTSTTDAPIGRYLHTAVWTGTKMIIWGGWGDFQCLNSGSVYDPVTDTWSQTSLTNAPSPRIRPTAVWTGSKMIIWGGYDYSNYLNDGGIYDPVNNSWITTSIVNAPKGRMYNSVIWTGEKMIVWGGKGPNIYYNSGGIYNPETDSWAEISMNKPPSIRIFHSAVWTGNKMIIWGGEDTMNYFNNGGIYDLALNKWESISILQAPCARYFHTAFWTGSKMIVWGGYSDGIYYNSGGIYFNDSLIGIKTGSLNVPKDFSLSQNYPNPFNPATIINYQLPVSSVVKLAVYDVLGKEITTLVNEKQHAGSYKVEFDGSNLPSGVYFYKLQSEGFIQTKKMVLIK